MASTNGLGPYWADRLWHEMQAQGRARLATAEELQRGPRHLTPEQEQRRREGVARHHARKRAARGAP